MLPFNFHDHVKAGFLPAFMLFLCYNNARVNFVESPETLDIEGLLKIFGFYLTQADALGRVVIPKEIRRTMRIREGDPLEIYTTRDGEVIFKKYSLIGGLEDFAAQFCDTLARNTDFTAAVTDRDGIVAVAGAGRRELLGKNLSPQLEQIMEQRSIYQYRSGQERLPVSESTGQYAAAVAAPILCGGDVLGLVLFVSAEDRLPGEGEYKLAQAVAGFLGKHMEA